jgi:hypothetical protein
MQEDDRRPLALLGVAQLGAIEAVEVVDDQASIL